MSNDKQQRNAPWLEIAHRGEFSLDVFTAARAREGGTLIPLLPRVAFLAFVNPDDSNESVPIQFLSLAALAEFCAEMQPREIAVASTDAERCAARSVWLTLLRAASPTLLQ